MVRNFFINYGKKQFQSLLEDFQNHRSNQEIANDLGVTRSRVKQWKDAFGEKEEVYIPFAQTVGVIEGTISIKDKKVKREISNMVKLREISGFSDFVSRLVRCQSGEVIAKAFKLSRQRVNDLKHKFGQTKTTFTVHPDVNSFR